MAESTTMFTAGAIARLAFYTLSETTRDESATKYSDPKYSDHAIEQISNLREAIETQLTQKSATAKSAIEQAKQGNEQAVGIVANFLDVEMMMDEAFALDLQRMAQMISAGRIRKPSSPSLGL